MSAGLCTIVSDICGICADAAPTFKVRNGDAGALAEAMERVQALSGEARESEARRARAAMARYSIENWVRRIMEMMK